LPTPGFVSSKLLTFLDPLILKSWICLASPPWTLSPLGFFYLFVASSLQAAALHTSPVFQHRLLNLTATEETADQRNSLDCVTVCRNISYRSLISRFLF
jgi:hypothetical protein